MKRTAVLALAIALLLNACVVPGLPSLQQPPTEAPVVDAQATEAAMAAETLNALPTPTLEPATDTPEPTATETESPTATETATEAIAETVTETLSVTGTVTPPLTATLAVATATETLHPRFYGTLPPAIPYGKVRLINRSKAEVYISMQCTTIDGYTTIIEYPVFGRMTVSAPLGRYTYVAWVGGRQFQGWFGLGKGDSIEITFEKDKVKIK